jgi:D-alanyl-D-alanine carboxypeptidase
MRSTRRGTLAALASVAVAACAAGAASAPSHGIGPARSNAELQRIVRGLVAAGAPGALAVVRAPDGTRRAAAGLAAISPRVRMRVTDRYRIASVTKTFVATVVLQLASEGRLALTDSVDRWLPGLVPGGEAITLRQLLNHTSGLFDYDGDPAWIEARVADPGREWRPRELVAVATSHPPLFAPGTSWSYSNTNYVLLGLVVEAVTGSDLGVELRDRIVRRLGLVSTSYPTGTAIEGAAAHGYVGSGSGLPIPTGVLIDATRLLSPSAWGAGQLVSNADDLTRFLAALLKGRLLPAARLNDMKTLVPTASYGLGVRSAATSCGRAYGHNGDVPGYRNVVWGLGNGRRVAAIMVNVDTTHVPWSRLEAAARTALCFG